MLNTTHFNFEESLNYVKRPHKRLLMHGWSLYNIYKRSALFGNIRFTKKLNKMFFGRIFKKTGNYNIFKPVFNTVVISGRTSFDIESDDSDLECTRHDAVLLKYANNFSSVIKNDEKYQITTFIDTTITSRTPVQLITALAILTKTTPISKISELTALSLNKIYTNINRSFYLNKITCCSRFAMDGFAKMHRRWAKKIGRSLRSRRKLYKNYVNFRKLTKLQLAYNHFSHTTINYQRHINTKKNAISFNATAAFLKMIDTCDLHNDSMWHNNYLRNSRCYCWTKIFIYLELADICFAEAPLLLLFYTCGVFNNMYTANTADANEIDLYTLKKDLSFYEYSLLSLDFGRFFIKDHQLVNAF